jgi:CheY-like chemotaxis protein
MLPGVDGFEVCRQIKQSGGGANTTVIAITGLDDPGHKERIMNLGASHFLQKPADTAQIRDLVRESVASRVTDASS